MDYIPICVDYVNNNFNINIIDLYLLLYYLNLEDDA